MHHFKMFAYALALFVTIPVLGAGLDVAKILRKADEGRAPQGDYSVAIRVTDFDGSEEKKSAYKISVKGTSLCLVEQTEPLRLVGRKLLMRDYNLWLYTPNISRPTRISFEQKLTGEVANGDLMRTNFTDDYNGQLLGKETLDGVEAYKINLTAKTKEVTYRSVDYWVDVKTNYPIKAIFYAASGKALKVATYHDFKMQLGKNRFSRAEITDLLQKNRRSQIIYVKYKKEKFALSIFSKESLGQ